MVKQIKNTTTNNNAAAVTPAPNTVETVDQQATITNANQVEQPEGTEAATTQVDGDTVMSETVQVP